MEPPNTKRRQVKRQQEEQAKLIEIADSLGKHRQWLSRSIVGKAKRWGYLLVQVFNHSLR